MDSPPTSLGPYEIIREIARSNDIVYEGFDSGTNRRVAVKQLSIPVGSSDPQTQDRVARFQREAKAVGSLNHPNIMIVYSFAQDAGRWYLAMEFLDGVTLRKEIDSKGVIEPERAVEIAVETLAGLSHAHKSGVIHRDIKPDNIQIVSSGQVKITDFGIARLTFDRNITIDGQVFGTPSYMSPEQVVGREIDQRSDLFSVGVMLYEMLTGVKPFVGDSVVTITYNIVNTTATQPPTISNALWSVVSRSIDKVPANRYASADEMIHALQEAVRIMNEPVVPAAPWAVGAPATHNPYAAQGYAGSPAYGAPPSPYGAQGIGAPGNPTALPPILGTPSPSPYGNFNPYGGAPQPPTYGSGPNFSNLPGGGMMPPMYYPPPPRAPMLKPETRDALMRFLGVFVTVGLLFLIVGYAFKVMVDGAISGSQNRSHVGGRSSPTPPSSTSAVSTETVANATPTPQVAPVVTEENVEPATASEGELRTMEQQCVRDPSTCAEFNGALTIAANGTSKQPALPQATVAVLRQETVAALINVASTEPMKKRTALQSAADIAKPDPHLFDYVRQAASQLDPNLEL